MSSELLLSSVCEIVMGQSPSGDDCNGSGEGMPLLNGPSEFGPHHPVPVQYTTDVRKVAHAGDLLFCVRGSTTGRMNWADRDYAIGRGLAAIRGKNGYPNSFVRAVIETKLPELLQSATGSTFPNVGKESFAALTFPVTELTDAKYVAVIFEALDDRITLLRETNQTLEAIAQAIFKSWFVDFDPVRAKMEGRQPVGMDEETAALFPDELVESELGLIPKGWDIELIGELLFRLPISKRYTKKQVLDSGEHPVYEQGVTILMGFHNDDPSCNASPEKPLFIFGDHTCITKLSCEPFDISQNVILLEGSKRNSFWTFYAVQGKQTFQEYRRHWMELITKTIVVPSPQLCDAYYTLALPIHLKIEANFKTITTLTNLRDTLLPRLISGKLRVPVDKTEAVTNED